MIAIEAVTPESPGSDRAIEKVKTPLRNSRQTEIRHFLFFAIGIITVSIAQTTIACMCIAYPENVEEAVALACTHADVAFLGKVTSIKRIRLQSLPARDVTFEILESWKGMLEDALVAQVRTNVGEYACGFKFKRRGQYLVFAHRDDPQGNVLTTSLCDLTKEQSLAHDYVAALKKLAAFQHGCGEAD